MSRVELAAAAPEGVDLANGEVLLALELFEPTLAILPTVYPETCLEWAPVRLVLYLSSSSAITVWIGRKEIL